MKGWIVLNGNIRLDVEFFYRYADRLKHSHHIDPAIREWRKVLLITAAWQENEFEEAHLKRALTDIGIPSRFEGGFDQNIQNLGLYHELKGFFQRRPEIHRQYREKQLVIHRTKDFYRRKNSDFVRILREQTTFVEGLYPGTRLADILAYDVVHHRGVLKGFNEKELLYHYSCEDVQDTLEKIVENDDRMLKICQEIDHYFRERTMLEEDPHYIQSRDDLRSRVLSANSVVIPGGNLMVLIEALQFFRLKGAFHEAMWRGTNFYSISAGSMVLAEKLIVYDDFWSDGETRPRKEFELFDQGLGLVSRITLFPHCMDRIQTDDDNNLAYLAHRFSTGPCVGLNENSFMLVETQRDAVSGLSRERFLSVGVDDGVYVFDLQGRKSCRRAGEEIVMPGMAPGRGL